MRAFLILAVVGAALAPPGLARARPTPAPRPNILLVVADDWSWAHAGANGDRAIRTPNFDRVAREGALFSHAFAAAPSCTPSRAAILTGKYPHQLDEGGNLHGTLPRRFAVYPDRLEAAGYAVGLHGKGWGPGNVEKSERARNPAGPAFPSFAEFLKTVPAGKPFAFWYGSTNPHRPYERGAGLKSGHRLEEVDVLPDWPDTPAVRGDVLDYYSEVEAFDRELGDLLRALEDARKLDDTLLVVTSDNGMPFPRGKTTLYDLGTRMPLAVRWPKVVQPRVRVDAFVNLLDLAPTFLDAAGIEPPRDMAGRSLLPLLRTGKDRGREQVFLERERHANVRKGNLGYPARAVRTRDFLYVRNLRPERWPGGDPEMWVAVGPFGDTDEGPTKDAVLAERGELFDRAFAKRPAEELYDLAKDRAQLHNVAAEGRYALAKKRLADLLDGWRHATKDPRLDPDDNRFDEYAYYGAPGKPHPERKP